MPGGDGNGPVWAYGTWNCRRGFRRPMRVCPGYGRTIAANQDQVGSLRAYADELSTELENVKKRIGELEQKQAT